MEEVVADQPADRQIHVILDNLNTHEKNEDWLAEHPNVTFHFTEQLTRAIHDFTAAYNENASPFAWRKREVRDAQLRNTNVNLFN